MGERHMIRTEDVSFYARLGRFDALDGVEIDANREWLAKLPLPLALAYRNGYSAASS